MIVSILRVASRVPVSQENLRSGTCGEAEMQVLKDFMPYNSLQLLTV